MHETFWQNTIVASCSQTRQLSGKTPLLLDDPAVVWAVLEGRVEVYGVRVREGRPVGARRHLCTVVAGDILTGLGSIKDDPTTEDDGTDLDQTSLALLASGLPGTSVGRLDARQVLTPSQWPEGSAGLDRTVATARLVDRFLLGLCAGLSRDIALKPGQHTELVSGMVIDLARDFPQPLSRQECFRQPSSRQSFSLQAPSHQIPPPQASPPQAPQTTASRIIRPAQGVWWLRLVGERDATLACPSPPEGSVCYLGLEDVETASPVLGCVLTPETWVEMTGRADPSGRGCSLEVLETRDLLAGNAMPGKASSVLTEALSNALDRFGKLFPRCLDLEMRLADADVYTALHTRAQAAHRAQKAGLRRLRGVLDQGRIQDQPDSTDAARRDPLAAAGAMVLRAMGVVAGEDDPPQRAEHGATGQVDRAGQVGWAEKIGGIADFWGIKHRFVSLGPGWWKRDGGPLLGFRGPGRAGKEGDHGGDPVALLQPGPERYEAHDPARGTRTPITAANAPSFSTRAVSFSRPFPDIPMGVADLIRFALFGTRRDFLFMLVCGLALAVLAVLPPVAVKLIFSDVIPAANRFFLAEITAMLVVVSVSVFAISLTRIAALQRMAGKMDFQLEPALWERLISLPAAFYRREAPGELADRADGLNIVRVRLCDTFLTTLLSGIFAASNVAMLFVFSPGLALPALGMLLLGALLGALFNLRQVAGWRRYFMLQGRISARLVQFFSGMAKIRMSGAEDRVFALWAEDFAEQQTQLLRTGKEQNRLLIFNMLFPVAAMTALFYLAAGLSGPMLETGSFLAFLAAFLALQAALLAITASAVQLSSIVPLYQRMRPILETLPEGRGPKHLQDRGHTSDREHDRTAGTDRAAGLVPDKLNGRIELARVHFRYDQDGPLILDGISLVIEPGEFVALVGPSGSGKSTVLRLLLGFETPDSGSVRFDDMDLADLDVPRLRRRHFGVVLQQTGLLPGTILTNIIGMGGLGEDQAWEAARLAGLAEDIAALPLGLHTPLGEGGITLSTGQRQRLAITRALAGKPSILLLDEATSALDNRTQDIVAKSLDSLRVTRVVVAHRLSTVHNADRVVLLDQGRIIESGTCQELMARQGRFADLVQRQLLTV